MEFFIRMRNSLISHVRVAKSNTESDKRKSWEHIAEMVNKDTNAGISVETCLLLWKSLKKEALSHVNKKKLEELAMAENLSLGDIYKVKLYKAEWDCAEIMSFYIPDETKKFFLTLIRDAQPDQLDAITSSTDSCPDVSLSPIGKRKTESKNVTKKSKKKKTSEWRKDYMALRSNCRQLIPSMPHLTVAILFVAGYGTIQELANIKDATIIAIQNSVSANVDRLADVNREAFDVLCGQNDFVIDVGVRHNILDLAIEARKYFNLKPVLEVQNVQIN